MELKQLQKLRAEHHEWEDANGKRCLRCLVAWPCTDAQILDMALESFELRGLAKAAQLNYINESLEAERLRTERDAWMKATMAGAAHICCEDCQSECDHVPGFGFDSEMYDSALAGTHRQARSLGDQALGVCESCGKEWPCTRAGTEGTNG